ncbi:MAG TPA: enoyl-CoA hydratase-related protein [Syntrophales bacterium]|nr:enoyl-CoA hydratase-related protein [Syntrophales bacterium]HPQ44525.1 enoyl-CoA hydratase-related protein [Syntrophales bacterium]
MSDNLIVVTREEAIATVMMNRPEMMNALNLDMIAELQDALNEIAEDYSVKVIILEGAGGNFSTGSSMELFTAALPAPYWQHGMLKLHHAIRTMREMPQPIVAKVRGMAIGGGINIALACDFVVAADTARFQEVFVHHGLIIDCGGTHFLPRLVGMVKAKELALLGERFDGKAAAEIGLIYKSVPDEKLDGEVDALATKLAQKPLTSLSLIKTSLEKSFDMSLINMLEWEAAQQAIMVQTDELIQAGNRFFQKKEKK